MALELKDVLDVLGLPTDVDSKEKLAELHRKNYITKAEAIEDDEVVKKVEGRIYGGLTTEAKRLFGFSKEEIKDKPFKDILREGAERFATKITELEEASGKGSEEVVKRLNGELEKFKNQANQYKTDLEKVIGEKSELENGFTQKLKEFKVQSAYKEAFSQIPLSETANDLTKRGFNDHVRSTYKFDVDEEENVIVLDAKGQKVPNPTKTGAYLGLVDVLKMEAEKNGILKKNNAGANHPSFQFGQRKEEPGGDPPKPKREISTAAKRAAEELKRQAQEG